MAHAHIRNVEGGYVLEWDDWPFANQHKREYVCRTIEEVCTRTVHLFKEIEGRTAIPCPRCQGTGRDPSSDDMTGTPCERCNGNRALQANGEPVEL